MILIYSAAGCPIANRQKLRTTLDDNNSFASGTVGGVSGSGVGDSSAALFAAAAAYNSTVNTMQQQHSSLIAAAAAAASPLLQSFQSSNKRIKLEEANENFNKPGKFCFNPRITRSSVTYVSSIVSSILVVIVTVCFLCNQLNIY